MLKKTIENSKKLSLVSDKAKVIWFMMLPHTDQAGRIKACARIVKGQYLTMLDYTEKDIQAALTELHQAGLLVVYSKNGDQFAEYTRFGDFQKIRRDRESESSIPPPLPEYSGATLENSGLSLSLSLNKKKDIPNGISKENFKDYWNSKNSLPKIQTMTKGRTAKLETRLKDPVFRDRWKDIIDKVNQSSFCTGKNNLSWTVSVDWVLKNDTNYQKVLEGKYDDKISSKIQEALDYE